MARFIDWLKRGLCPILTVASWAYLAVLFAWIAVHLLTGDRFIYVALLNYLAQYLFFPLILVLLVALFCDRRSLWVGLAIGVIAFAWFWGELFLPPLTRPPETDGPSLKVMTYNVLAWHNYDQAIIETIRAEDADVVLLQELNPAVARALARDLAEHYPYQEFEPAPNPTGIGVISKFPIRPTGERLPLRWVGGPQILELQWNGLLVTLVNFHMYPTAGVAPREAVEYSIQLRQSEASLLADLARRSDLSIVGGDANTSSLSEAYQILTTDLQDAWRQAGFGFGHTFPGSTIPESDRPRIGNWYVPAWLVRIDYVFHSEDWVALQARTARFDGVSDHRGVVAVLALRKP